MKKIKKLSYKSRREDTIVDPCPDCVAHDVTIGTQTWAGCNATMALYNNGDTIPYVDDPAVWITLTTGAWCWYNNDPANEATYGKLYNWYAITDPRGIAPSGYHVPTDAEWNTLITNLGGESVAGGKLKEDGLCHWISPNTGASNISGFTGLPGGYRSGFSGSFSFLGSQALFIGSSLNINNDSYFLRLQNIYQTADTSYGLKKSGLSLRFIKDPVVACPDIVIGTQTWASCNLDVSTYRNGDIIPQVTDPTAWNTLTTGAWCWYNNDPANGAIYGKLYNAYAVNDPRGLAPSGYHIPTDAEFTTLTNYLGGNTVAGGAMKESGTSHWQTPNTGATNSSGFTSLPGGFRGAGGGFGEINRSSYYRGASSSFGLIYTSASKISAVNTPTYGFSVRVIKD